MRGLKTLLERRIVPNYESIIEVWVRKDPRERKDNLNVYQVLYLTDDPYIKLDPVSSEIIRETEYLFESINNYNEQNKVMVNFKFVKVSEI